MGCCLLVVNKLGGGVGWEEKQIWGQLEVISVVPGSLHYKSKSNLNRNMCSHCFMNTFMKSHGFQKEEL